MDAGEGLLRVGGWVGGEGHGDDLGSRSSLWMVSVDDSLAFCC